MGSKELFDNVNPRHYKKGTMECIDAMRLAFGDLAVSDFCRCNAFKYIWRCGDKNGHEDLDKAEWYLAKAKELDVNPTNEHTLMQNMIEKAKEKL